MFLQLAVAGGTLSRESEMRREEEREEVTWKELMNAGEVENLLRVGGHLGQKDRRPAGEIYRMGAIQ